MDKHRHQKVQSYLKGLLEQRQENIKHHQCALQMSESSQTLIDARLFRQMSFQEAEFWRPTGEAMGEEAFSPKSD